MTTLDKSQIIEMDIETSNACNLDCPLCLSRIEQLKDIFKDKHFIDIAQAIKTIEQFPNLDQVTIAGDASEPTLHPQLFDLLDYFKGRPEIFLQMFTNGSTHDQEYWAELAGHFSQNSIVVFTICGMTQELHSRYRVGSQLSQILENAAVFRAASQHGNDCGQYIRFQYNRSEADEDVSVFLQQHFSRHYICNTNPIFERLHPHEKREDGICSLAENAAKYKIKRLQLRSKDLPVSCYMFNKRQICMDNRCNLYPCNFCRIYDNGYEFQLEDGRLDYTPIFSKECPYCYECNEEMLRFFNDTDIRQSFMC